MKHRRLSRAIWVLFNLSFHLCANVTQTQLSSSLFGQAVFGHVGANV